MSEHAELIKDFLVESYENLDRLDRDFVELEKNPDDRETISSIFRTIHTIKGTCGFLGFHKLESVTHVGENLLSKLRDGALKLNVERTSAMLAMVDATRQILNAIETTTQEGEADYGPLVKQLERLIAGELGVMPGAPSTSASSTAAAPVSAPIGGDEVIDASIDAALATAVPAVPTVDVAALATEAATSAHSTFAKPQAVVVDGTPVAGKVIADPSTHKPAETEVKAAVSAGGGGGGGGGSGGGGGVADQAIRVDVTLLDKLMNLVGELVLARNQILQHTAALENSALGATTQRLNLITTELQEGVMKTRMQPINIVWQKLPRVVRDLSNSLGKQIRLEMEGKDTELDKTIVEAIKDPLTHIVRNSVDHGVETPEKRTANGKPAEGTLKLRAFHEGGQVNIEIIDDGAGINPDKVKAKALDKGLITAEQAARMGEREAVNLIFLPGFSTAEKITNVSGRGVGMDVVKTNIEKIGGTVDVTSRPGNGTTLRIKIPLTLAIIPALLVTSGGERFAIPQVSLLELVRLEGDQARKQIESIHGAPVYRLRGNLLPLTYLNRQLKLPLGDPDAAVNVVVLQADGRQFGLVVDEINDTEEIVVKPLGKQLKSIASFAGATIMGDGKVALILDVMGLAQSANMVGGRDKSLTSDTASASTAGDARTTLLLLKVGSRRRMAVPLNKVSRLEEFQRDAIETEGDTEVVQYRGKIMPLLRLSTLFPDAAGPAASESADTVHVVVYSRNGLTAGLVVDAILDIVDETLTVDPRKSRSGVLGSAVVQNKVTELLDVDSLVADALGADETETPRALAA